MVFEEEYSIADERDKKIVTSKRSKLSETRRDAIVFGPIKLIAYLRENTNRSKFYFRIYNASRHNSIGIRGYSS